MAVETDGRPRHDRWTQGPALAAAAHNLTSTLVDRPWGRISPSVYETGRLVAFAPWLTGHARRVDFLLSGQRPDGSWGQGDGYQLVPTLSATEALLGCAFEGAYSRLTAAVDRGLNALFSALSDPTGRPVPDTPAIELIVPALVRALNRRLDQLGGHPLAGLDRWRGSARLPLPSPLNSCLLTAVRSRLETGSGVPEKLLHSLEVFADSATTVTAIGAAVRPVAPGTVGASPAATAAWLAGTGPGRDPRAVRYLEAVVGRHDGPVPSVVPITAFERAWVLSTFFDAGISVDLPEELVSFFKSTLAETGTPGGAGLPPDADTTSVTVRTLARLGSAPGPGCLWSYDAGTHFQTWQAERTPSTTTNAHVLEAFGDHVARRADASPRERAVVRALSAWLADQQLDDGSWRDKWHASPYYATTCCALALDRYGGEGSDVAVSKAVRWVLASQRADGSWGRWQGTVEETAYAMRVLLSARSAARSAAQSVRQPAERAAARGYRFLLDAVGRQADPPLWHDKDLYIPTAVVKAVTIVALWQAGRRPDVVASPGLPPVHVGHGRC